MGNVRGSAPQNRDVASVARAVLEALRVRLRSSWPAQRADRPGRPPPRIVPRPLPGPAREPGPRLSRFLLPCVGVLHAEAHGCRPGRSARREDTPLIVASVVSMQHDLSRWSADNDDDVIFETDRKSKCLDVERPRFAQVSYEQYEAVEVDDVHARCYRRGSEGLPLWAIEAGLTGTAVAGSSALGRPIYQGAVAMIFGSARRGLQQQRFDGPGILSRCLGVRLGGCRSRLADLCAPPGGVGCPSHGGGWRARAVLHVRRPPW